MSIEDEILVGKLYGLEADIYDFNASLKTYYEVCERLDVEGKKQLRLADQYNKIVSGESGGNVKQVALVIALSKREWALLMAEASRHLARLSSKSFSMAEKMEITCDEPGC